MVIAYKFAKTSIILSFTLGALAMFVFAMAIIAVVHYRELDPLERSLGDFPRTEQDMTWEWAITVWRTLCIVSGFTLACMLAVKSSVPVEGLLLAACAGIAMFFLLCRERG